MMVYSSTVRSPLKWVGGKFHLAQAILAAFPDPASYTTYVEPCGGAAHILLQKPSYGHREVYNDLNDDLVNFWRQMLEHGDVLAQRLQALPYSRALYYEAHVRLMDGSFIDPVERAILFFYLLRGTGTGWIRPSAVGWNNTASSAVAYRSMVELFEVVQKRLTQPRVLIDDRDVERVIEEYDSTTTLHYVDPPYVGAEHYYSYRAGGRKVVTKHFDHQRLAEVLNQVKGYVALSYYAYPEMESWYPSDRWRYVRWEGRKKPSAIPAGGELYTTELLLCNYPEAKRVNEQQLFSWTTSEEGAP
jgi:DNA adenine methylase